jgi:hypothetical protein
MFFLTAKQLREEDHKKYHIHKLDDPIINRTVNLEAFLQHLES